METFPDRPDSFVVLTTIESTSQDNLEYAALYFDQGSSTSQTLGNYNNNIPLFQGMLNHLKDKKDVGFFTSIAGLMNSCR
jgi:hypothetical protein